MNDEIQPLTGAAADEFVKEFARIIAKALHVTAESLTETFPSPGLFREGAIEVEAEVIPERLRLEG